MATDQQYLSVNIIRRFMDDKAWEEFFDEYRNHLHVAPSGTKPTENQFKLAEMRKNGKSVHRIVEELKDMGVTETQVHSAVARVSRWTYFHPGE